ncbi:MAG TPA: universal stress protein [Ktedonobacteraceae bacterium]|nr:universal stress protein [Ktedonobacteraceae bacterium]
MNKRILLGIDTGTSATTRQAVHAVAELMESASPHLHVVLLTVIPVPYMASPSLGMYTGQVLPISVTLEQRSQAEASLRKVQEELQEHGIDPEQIETLVRVGIPPDEIVKAAKELHVSFIVIGSHGDSAAQKLRRFLVGSTSRRVLSLAPCPVIVATLPRTRQPSDLINWYENAIIAYLREHPGSLTVFTPLEVAQKFAPPGKKTSGRKEIAAATLALERLASNGVLCCHDIKGELRYVND